MRLSRLDGEYAVARSGPATPVPEGFLDGAGFISVSRNADELSAVAPLDAFDGIDVFQKIDTGWTTFKVHGPFAFDETGIVAGLSRPLADAELGIFVISTFDTDYILVKQENADAVATLWRNDGHTVD